MMQIESRYQHYTKNGVEWTKWFTMLGEPTGTEADCKARIKVLQANKPQMGRSTKLSHEYRINNTTKDKNNG